MIICYASPTFFYGKQIVPPYFFPAQLNGINEKKEIIIVYKLCFVCLHETSLYKMLCIQAKYNSFFLIEEQNRHGEKCQSQKKK